MKRLSIVVPLGIGKDFNIEKSLGSQKEKVKLIVEIGNNTSKNRNQGIDKAKTEFVAFINGHTILENNWLDEVLNFFDKNKEIDIVGGPQLTPEEQGRFAKASGYALSSKFGAWKIANRYSGKDAIKDADETMLTSANLICRKKVFRKVKFDEGIYPGEDPKFISDAKKSGFKVAYSPEIKVYNRRRESLRELSKQIFSYGKTRTEKERLSDTLKMPFFLVPSLFVVYLFILLLFLALSLFSEGIAFFHSRLTLGILLSPLIFYLLLNLLFSVFNSMTNRDASAVFLLPLIYLVIHLSYGAGFLYGKIKK